jgi:hypothetical protein
MGQLFLSLIKKDVQISWVFKKTKALATRMQKEHKDMVQAAKAVFALKQKHCTYTCRCMHSYMY